MAIVVNAGDYVKADINIQNIGQQAGTFRIRAVVVPDGGTVAQEAQRFYNAIGYSPTNPAPVGAEIATSSLTVPNTSSMVTMYTNQWADNNPLKYTSQRLFDVVFEVVVVETSEVFNFRGENILQHQTLAPAKPDVVGVDYIIQIPTGVLITP